MSTKNEILNRAKQFFAEKGYEGTIMDELASAANVNKATIYYHFKDKENLYKEAFQDSINSIYKDLKTTLENINNPKEALKIYITTFYKHAEKDDTFIRILMREIASNGKYFPHPVMEIFQNIVKMLDKILKDGYKKSIFRKYNTRVVHFMVIGAISYFIASEPIRKGVLKQFDDFPEFLAVGNNISSDLYKIILNGLEKKS